MLLIAGDKPGFADVSVFVMMRDDQIQLGKLDMSDMPNLAALYAACDAVPDVRSWIESAEAAAEKASAK